MEFVLGRCTGEKFMWEAHTHNGTMLSTHVLVISSQLHVLALQPLGFPAIPWQAVYFLFGNLLLADFWGFIWSLMRSAGL